MKAACQHPEHEGDRLVDRRDLTERRTEWRDLVNQGRYAVRIVRRECKACVTAELHPDAQQEFEHLATKLGLDS